MRFAVKSSLVLIALYLLIAAGLGAILEWRLSQVASAMMEEVAGMLGREISVSLAESNAADILAPDPASRRQLLTVMTKISRHSDLVRSLSVVAADGEILSSTRFDRIGGHAQAAAMLFQGRTGPLLTHAPRSIFAPGSYTLYFPLIQSDQIEGYIRMSLANQRLAEIFRAAGVQVAAATGAGLLIALVVAGLLNVRLSRRADRLAATLEQAARGQGVPPPPRDEFARAFEIADRIGRELSSERQKSNQLESQLGALAQALNAGVLLIGASGRLEFVSPPARELLGLNGPEALEELWDRLSRKLPDRGEMGRVFDLDLGESGELRRLRFEAWPLTDDGDPSRLLVVRDRGLTDRLETDLRMATQLRALARVFLAVVHDLKAPLNAITLNLELLGRSVEGDDSVSGEEREKRQRYLGVVKRELRELDGSLQQLLSETVVTDERVREFDLGELIETVGLLLQPQARYQSVTLSVDLPDQDVRVSGARDWIRQALLNLAINSLEAMPDGGALTMRLRPLSEKGEALIEIEDDGPGIPPELEEHIFELHFTTKESGTGVGLHVARSVIEAAGGRLTFEQPPVRGARFVVELPTVSNSGGQGADAARADR